MRLKRVEEVSMEIRDEPKEEEGKEVKVEGSDRVDFSSSEPSSFGDKAGNERYRKED